MLLDRCQPYPMPEPTLLQSIMLALPGVAVTEFFSALHELAGEQLVASVRPSLGGPLKWSITTKGRAAVLAQ
jgi:hypothetical protein